MHHSQKQKERRRNKNKFSHPNKYQRHKNQKYAWRCRKKMKEMRRIIFKIL